uniref:MFS domain-containing protein n=1 Tax=Ascaris lumbricoides TaxID=6252 RepID=A0A0M3HVI0_ASCLU
MLRHVDPEAARQHDEYIAHLHEHPSIAFHNHTRYVIMVISTVCLAWLMGNSLLLNFTIICMSDDEYGSNITQSTREFSQIASLITALRTIAFSFITFLRYRNLFTLFGALSAVSTLFVPLSASIGFWCLFLMRFLQGFALAISYPVLGAIASNWSPLKQSGMYTAWMSCNLQFGPMFTLPVSGAFCVSSFGWEGVYYVQGFLTLISYLIFYLLFRDSPRIHGFVSAKELRKIEEGKTAILEMKVEPVPYLAIFKSIPIWGVWICCTGATFGYQIFVQYGPIYLNKVLNYEITNTGFMTAFPNLVSCFAKILGGPISDMASCVSVKNRVKIFTIISQGTMALSFVCLALVPPSMVFLAQIAYTAAVAFSGLMWVGPVKSGSLVARQHAHFVFAVMSIINSAGILVLPPFVNAIAPNNTPQQWSVILYTICASVVICTAMFAFVGEAEPAWWTEPNAKHHHSPHRNAVHMQQVGNAAPC